MFKKIIAVFIAVMMIASYAYAVLQIQQVDRTELMYKQVTAIDAVLLDDSPTSYTSAGIFIQDLGKVAFFWKYDETQVGATVSGALTIEISFDNVTYLAASFYDYAGGATLQTSESLSADGTYYCWFNNALCVPFVRVKVTGTSTDADDTILTSVYVCGKP